MLNKYLITFLLLSWFTPKTCYSEIQTKAGGGVHFSDGFTTKATSATTNLPLLRSTNGLGIQAFLGQQIGSFNIGIGGQYTYQKSKAQYNYIDPDNSSRKANVSDLLTSAYFYNLDLLLSFDLFSLGKLHFVVGGGPTVGFSILAFDEDDFYRKNSSGSGMIKGNSDVASLVGYFGEAGFEIRGNEFGGQLKASYHNSKSGKFVSLSNGRIQYEEKSIVFNFLRILK